MKCANCGAKLNEGDRFCPICGLSTTGDNFPSHCEVCGAEMNQRDCFCPSCGNPVNEISGRNAELMRKYPSSRLYIPERHKTLNVGLLLTILLILLASAAFLSGTVLGWWQL